MKKIIYPIEKIEENLKDTERLDWWFRDWDDRTLEKSTITYFCRKCQKIHESSGKTFRHAIDKAMLEEKE
jgi:hypothetical protein